MWPFSSRKVAVGVDIGSSSFRVARLAGARGKGKPQLTLVGSISVPRGAIVGGEIVDVEVVAQSLQELWKKTGLKEKEVVLGVANQRVVVRLIDFPYMEPAELKSAIQFQAQDFIPLPIEDVILDYQVLTDYYTDAGDRMLQILLVAAQKGMVETFVAAAEKAGLKPSIIDVNAFAIARALAGTATEAAPGGGDAEATTAATVEEPPAMAEPTATPRAEAGYASGAQEEYPPRTVESAAVPPVPPTERAAEAQPPAADGQPAAPASESAGVGEPFGFETISSDEFGPSAQATPDAGEPPAREGGPDLVNDGGEAPEVALPARQGVTAIVDIGAEITNLVILEGDNPKFVRVIGVGGESWTEAIVEQLGYAFDEAEELKTKIGLPPLSGDRYLDVPSDMLDRADAVFSVLEREVVRFISEIRRSFEYYVSQAGGAEVRELIVTGGASNLRRLRAYVERGLGVEVKRGNPLAKVEVLPRVADQIPAGEEGSYAIAIGLALRGVE